MCGVCLTNLHHTATPITTLSLDAAYDATKSDPEVFQVEIPGLLLKIFGSKEDYL